MRRLLRASCLAAALSAACAHPGGAPQGERTPAGSAAIPADLPAGQAWLDHFRRDLLPFWDLPDAWGEPRGAFPTHRCNDGRRLDRARPCFELSDPPPWAREAARREWTRMRSRQTYLYGVAFHLTGDARYLALARDGATWIREHALDRETGSAITWFDEEGRGGPPLLERTSQDLAYAGLGLAMYWYLTRDAAVLEDLVRLKDHVFGAYWDERWGMLRWVAREGHEEAGRQELVAQLDQVNAYLLLVTPLLSEPTRGAWERDLLRLSRLLIARYHAPEEHLFWGTIHEPEGRRLGARHVDFGHTAKAVWMIERAGRLLGDRALVDFAAAEGPRVLERAFLPSTGSWASRPRPGGAVDAGKEWWIYAELDQLAATLALSDPGQARYLPSTFRFWLRHMVDRDGHEVYGWVGPDGQPGRGPKIHFWKSGYHSAEHALVAYLTAQSLRGEPAALHFAPIEAGVPVRPYLFAGAELGRTVEPLDGFPGRRRVTVRFGELR